MLGIDPDYQLDMSDRLLVQNIGSLRETLKQLHKQKFHLPKKVQDYSDRERLARHFETVLMNR
jgi:uncharacterized membrane protein